MKIHPPIDAILLHTYGTDENIADTEDEMTVLAQPPRRPSSQYPKELASKELQFIYVYGKHDHNETFNVKFDNSNQKSMR